MPREGSASLNREGGCWKTLRLATGLCTLSHKQNPMLAVRQFCDHITPNIWLPHSQDCSPLDYYVCGAVQNQRWTKDKNNGSIHQFKQGAHQKGLQEILKLSGGSGWSQWRFLWINWIYVVFECSIFRYFLVILVKSDACVILFFTSCR